MKRLYLILLLSGLPMAESHAQSTSLRGSVAVGGLSAFGQQTPYWLRTNQYGTVPSAGGFGTLRAGLRRDYNRRSDSTTTKSRSRPDWGFGVLAVVNAGRRPTSNDPALLLPDLYANVRLGRVELYAGNRREVAGIGDTLLTSGFMAWSGNALPFPKVQIHTPDYVPLGFTHGWLAFRAGYAHGWLINSYIQGSYLHQKYLYGRLGKPTARYRFYAGINHQVQWGGRADYLKNTDLAVDGKLPSSFRDYVSMITGSYPDALQNNRFTSFDGTNRIGNHLGTYDLALERNGTNSNWLFYLQHYYEDASGLALQNLPDGLTGLRWLNRRKSPRPFRLDRVVAEWVTTMNQSGPTFDPEARYQGADNYFNHSQYVEGWSYRGKTIGTPFITPRGDVSPDINNAYTGGGYFFNNRLRAYYLGMMGSFNKGQTLTLRLNYSLNYGTYIQPFARPFGQFSALVMVNWPVRRWSGTSITTSAALDRGDFLPASTGAFVSLRRDW